MWTTRALRPLVRRLALWCCARRRGSSTQQPHFARRNGASAREYTLFVCLCERENDEVKHHSFLRLTKCRSNETQARDRTELPRGTAAAVLRFAARRAAAACARRRRGRGRRRGAREAGARRGALSPAWSVPAYCACRRRVLARFPPTHLPRRPWTVGLPR